MMNYREKIWTFILVLVLSILPAVEAAQAQEELPSGPVYIIQEGDTLWDIAQRFGVPWEDLARENGISDPGQLTAGEEIIIPGLEGIGDVLVTTPVPLGENIRSLSRSFQIPEEKIINLNHLTSTEELYSGYNMVIPEVSQQQVKMERFSLANGQSLIELALKHGVSPWTLVIENHLEGTWGVIPGDVLVLQDQDSIPGPGGLPGEITALEISPEPLVQGETTVLRIDTSEEMDVYGSLIDHQLNFFRDKEGEYVALQGVHALTEPGYYSFLVEGELDNGVPFGFSQRIYLAPGDYVYKSLQVPEATLDPDVTIPEDKLWAALAGPVTPEQLWQGVFENPMAPSPCGYTDTFGHRRSYNGSPYNYFHTGLDFCYNYNNEVNEIYAPADGVVVFAGPLIVRGNAVMIDHGLGIYSGYMHQEEIMVEVGERVETGQVIGIVGGTGRVNGPHLHLEIWAGGVQVDPEDWLGSVYP
ncbi:MAG: LysM peptidoglycan-binding domain-containing M23 family metallopeptidase [Anaerolineales bacterium]|nr:LysM peptidoglycan-binding domain-containing M23 family metallopeptidase [Anaerolineales bacterium]